MDNKYILISLNYFEISIVTLVLLYTFLNTEKKYFTKIIVSAIAIIIVMVAVITMIILKCNSLTDPTYKEED